MNAPLTAMAVLGISDPKADRNESSQVSSEHDEAGKSPQVLEGDDRLSVALANDTPVAQPSPSRVSFQPSNRSQTFEMLGKTLPMNELGLPKFLYRADLIPNDYSSLNPQDQVAIQNMAVMAITYREGYPTFLDGSPIWEQMDTEADEDYGFYQLYLSLLDDVGYRQMSTLVNTICTHYTDLRTDSKDQRKAILWHLQELAATNFWFLRAKAHDLFKQAMHRKIRESRAMRMETYHFDKAQTALDAMARNLTSVFSDDRVSSMEPTDFVKAMKDLAQIQREALGSGSGRGTAASKNDPNTPTPGASVEITMRQVAKSSGADSSGGDKAGSNVKVLDMLRSNPEAVEAAQELILKLNMGGRTNNLEISDKASARDEAQDLRMITGEDDDG